MNMVLKSNQVIFTLSLTEQVTSALKSYLDQACLYEIKQHFLSELKIDIGFAGRIEGLGDSLLVYFLKRYMLLPIAT